MNRWQAEQVAPRRAHSSTRIATWPPPSLRSRRPSSSPTHTHPSRRRWTTNQPHPRSHRSTIPHHHRTLHLHLKHPLPLPPSPNVSSPSSRATPPTLQRPSSLRPTLLLRPLRSTRSPGRSSTFWVAGRISTRTCSATRQRARWSAGSSSRVGSPPWDRLLGASNSRRVSTGGGGSGGARWVRQTDRGRTRGTPIR